MGLFGRLFGSRKESIGVGDWLIGSTGELSVWRDGTPVVEVVENFSMHPRGPVLTGVLRQDVTVDQRVELVHPAGRRQWRIGGITVGDTTVQSASAGARAEVLLSR